MTMLKPIQEISTQSSQSSAPSPRQQILIPANSSASEPTSPTPGMEKDTLPANTTQSDSASTSSRSNQHPNAHLSDTVLNQTVREALQARLS